MPELHTHPVHLGRDATAESQPAFDGRPQWYEAYGARTQQDGTEGRLVSSNTFSSSWTHWEMHPHGAEVVLCTAGTITLVQEVDGRSVRTRLTPGHYAINEPGVWHTADLEGEATVLFITAGVGTEHRPR